MKNTKVLLMFINALFLFVVFASSGYCLQSYEATTESYQIIMIDGKYQFEWIGEVTNNTVLPISGVVVSVTVTNGAGNPVLNHSIGKFSLERFETKKVQFVIPLEHNEDVDSLEVFAEVSSPSQDIGWTDKPERVYEDRKDRTKDKERVKGPSKSCRKARSEAMRLGDKIQIKKEVYELCPDSYMSSSKCGKLRRDLDSLRKDYKKAERRMNRECKR